MGALWQGLKQIGDDAADIGSAVINGLTGNGLISDREIARVQRESLAKARSEYAGHQNYMAAQNLQLSDIADAVNAANNGGARGDANANMSKLLTALNNKFGLEGEDRITSAEDMQAVISSGRVNVNDVMTVALESSNNNATFANVYGVAGGVRSGSLVADDNGFYTKGGQMVAGRYVEPGTADYNKMIAGLYDNKATLYKMWASEVHENNSWGGLVGWAKKNYNAYDNAMEKAGNEVFVQNPTRDSLELTFGESISAYSKEFASRAILRPFMSIKNPEMFKEHSKKTLKEMALGRYSKTMSTNAVAGQVMLGFTGLDLPGDIRDLTHDFQNWKWSWGHAGATGLDMLAILPVIGALKYTRYAKKGTDLVDGVHDVTKNLDNISDVSKTGDALKDGIRSQRLLQGEGNVGSYGDLIKKGKKGDNITPHHIPSNEYMKKHGINKHDGLAINMEHPIPGKGGRHRRTRTYGRNMNNAQRQAYYNLSLRDALAHDIKDVIKIYKKQNLYTPEIKNSLKKIIEESKKKYPHLFNKKNELGVFNEY